MKKRIITYASLLAISTLGYAASPDLGDHYRLIQDMQIEHNITVDDLDDAVVVDKYGEKVATIEDFEVTPSSGKISTAYLQVGGVMGIGSQYVTLPYSALTYDKAKARFSVETTRSEMRAHIDQQNRKMKARKKAAKDGSDYDDSHDGDDRLSNMWRKVKSSLGVKDAR